LVFMDADKSQYIDYLKWAINSVKPGGLIIADNVIRDGEVINQQSSDPKAAHVRKFLEYLASQPGLAHCVVPTMGLKGYDGMSVSLKL